MALKALILVLAFEIDELNQYLLLFRIGRYIGNDGGLYPMKKGCIAFRRHLSDDQIESIWFMDALVCHI